MRERKIDMKKKKDHKKEYIKKDIRNKIQRVKGAGQGVCCKSSCIRVGQTCLQVVALPLLQFSFQN